MKQSEQIELIAKALSDAQGEMKNAICNKTNPYYHSRYADLSTVWDAIRPVLKKNGLSIIQSPSTNIGEKRVKITTFLTHNSGQYFSDELELPGEAPGKDGHIRFDAQTIGIAITYGRRYALSSMLGIAADDDDDGNELKDEEGKNHHQIVSKLPAKKIKSVGPQHKYTDEDLYRKCQDGMVACREDGIIDQKYFDNQMKELESIKNDYDAMVKFRKAVVVQYKAGKTKSIEPKPEEETAKEKEIF